jgi:Ca-activated chloride channel family protein
MESTPASPEARGNADRRLAGIDARGSTDLAGGWLRGCEQIALHLVPDSAGRCLLLTDGLANVGIIDHDELERHATELRARGVTTSTFGVGSDFDEVLLQRMAVAGGGHPYYIETPVQIMDLLTSELGETLEIAAHDAAVEVSLPAGATAECLNDFRSSQSDGALRIDLGSIISRQEVSLVVMLEFPGGEPGSQLEVQFRIKDREAALDAPPWHGCGHLRITRQMTTSRATVPSTGRWRSFMRHGPAARPFCSIGQGTTTARSKRCVPQPNGFEAMQETTRS